MLTRWDWRHSSDRHYPDQRAGGIKISRELLMDLFMFPTEMSLVGIHSTAGGFVLEVEHPGLDGIAEGGQPLAIEPTLGYHTHDGVQYHFADWGTLGIVGHQCQESTRNKGAA